ncbi:MAG: PLP-dependent aminotransferase family protein [Candidatus Tectomicrobia bacterium]
MARQPHLRINFNRQDPGRTLSSNQIVTGIKEQIVIDKVAPGCRLPPVRVLAHQLGMSKNTVQTAYDELVAQGLVESKERVGLFVAPDSQTVAVASAVKVPPPQVTPLPSSELMNRSRLTSGQTINLSSVFIDPELLPRERLAACFRAVVKQPKLHVAYHAQGFLPLRSAIAERLQKRGIEARVEDIITTAGSQQALDIVCRILKRKCIATENPTYELGKMLFGMNNVETTGLPLDPFHGVDVDKWEQTLARSRPALVYLTANYHNPTGYSYSTSELHHILDWSQQYGFGILEDDWGSDMLSFSEFRPSLRARGGSGVFYINSFTKKLLPSLRLGYIVGNEPSTAALVASKSVSCLGLSSIVEAALFEFLDRGYYDVHLKQLQHELDQRYRNCLKVLRQTMPAGVKWTAPGGGPSLWLEMPKRVEGETIKARLKARHVAIHLSHQAFFGRPHLNGFRIGYALLPPDELRRGIEIVAEELKRDLKT